MKVMREEESFKPVTIILESQDELDWLFCCLARTSTCDANQSYAKRTGVIERFTKVSGIGYRMYEALLKLVEGK